MKRITVLFLLFCLRITLFAQIPPAPDPPRLVNDFARILSSAEIDQLENRLVNFNDSTSNVICIVTVNDLGGYPAWQFAYEIGEQWGVENKGYKNGVVILIKPRNETAGEVYIAVGYSLEGAIPDAIAKRIVDQMMIPYLKDQQYYAAIEQALDVILPLAAGEISARRILHEDKTPLLIVAGIFILFIVIVVIILRKRGGGAHFGGTSGKSIWMGPIGGSGWGGSSGGSRGGFGGFGGSGGFGGVGAGGRF